MVAIDVQDIPYFTVEVDVQNVQDLPTKIIDELELSDIHLIEKYILDKEEMEAQEMEECIVELPDKQEIDREMVVLPEMPVKTSCEQEECTREEIFIRSLPELPELCKAEASIHEDDIQLETPKVNTTEICELPRKTELEIPEVNAVEIKELLRKIKLEMPIEQDKSKLHPQWKKVLGKVIRRENPIKLVKGEICSPPPKPPDRQNSLNHKHETKKGRVKPYENKKESQDIQNAEEEGIDAQKIDKEQNCRPPLKPPYILNANGEVIGIIENVVPKTRTPLKPPRIHGSVDREGIDQEKQCLLDTVSNDRLPPEPPPKSL